jgi:hypothetical protein
MKSQSNLKLPLRDAEKANLRKQKIKIADLLDYAVDELEIILNTSPNRSREIFALAQFQTIPTIGIKFAEDLVYLGYYSLDELRDKDGAKLTDAYEYKKGYQTDPCVEDQFRLVVHYASSPNPKLTWWDFTAARKQYRLEYGYPDTRPQNTWFEI